VGLFIISSLLILLGVGFGVWAVINNVNFTVMTAQIPGVIFAAVVVFLGVRYFISTLKLMKNIEGRQFSWKNFKRTAKERRS